MSPSSRALVVSLALASLVSCGNPAVDARIEALGDEIESVGETEFHRPGQPCVLCHASYEGAEPVMSVGGTIFAVPKKVDAAKIPVEGAVVRLTDASGDVFTSRATNCVGNFWITEEEWRPQFPLAVEVVYKDPATAEQKAATMSSRIGRDGSCASCHTLTGPDQASVGRVWCSNANPPPPFAGLADACPGKPWLSK